VFARVKKSATGSTMKAVFTMAGSTIQNSVVTVPDTTSWTLLDLGLMQVPAGSQGQADGYGAALGAVGVQAALRYSRTAGTGSLHTDYVLFLPADAELAQVKWPAAPTGPGFVFDGPNDEAYVRGTAGVNHAIGSTTAGTPEYAGGLPMVAPGATNRVFFVVADGAKSLSPTLYLSYWPRYIFGLRPTST
jgi:hypothetical protein